MQVFKQGDALRQQIKIWRQHGDRIAFVPTMGNLHLGHLALVMAAKEQVKRVIVSIFVNPMQFSAGEDFSAYPRTQTQDQEKLLRLNVDGLFLPSVEELYPRPLSEMTQIEVPYLSNVLCGVSRPGHFVGVVTVVAKLFNLVQADIAVFGEKDFQQLMLIRQMVMDLNINTQIVAIPIKRELDGLAMSSRNAYLSTEDRQKAILIHQLLIQMKDMLLERQQNFVFIEQHARNILTDAGFQVDYVSIRSAENLQKPLGNEDVVVLIAAKIGHTRLIDNCVVQMK